jgi:glycosyltransferase involved in cell wall biosynthesis
MPAYNSRYTIEESIRSALEQSHPAVEVIVVDDGSEDGTAGLVRSTFGERIRLIEAPHTGRAAARNLGLSLAKGSYVQYLDADDILAPGKVEEQVAFLEDHPDFAGAYGNVEVFWNLSPERWHFMPDVKPEGDVLPFMIDSGFLLTLGTLVRMDWVRRVRGFDQDLMWKEDWDHWLRIAVAGGRFARHPREGYVGYFRQPGLPGRAGSNSHLKLKGGVRVLRKLEQMLDPAAARQLRVRRAIGLWRFGYGRNLLLRGERVAGLRQMLRSLREDRRDLASKLAWLTLGAVLGGSRARAQIMRISTGAAGPDLVTGPPPAYRSSPPPA